MTAHAGGGVKAAALAPLMAIFSSGHTLDDMHGAPTPSLSDSPNAAIWLERHTAVALAGLIVMGVGYAIWEHRTQVRKEKGERSDRM